MATHNLALAKRMHRVLRLEHGVLIETNPATVALRCRSRGSSAVAFSMFSSLRGLEKLFGTPCRPYVASDASHTAASAGSSSALVQPDWWRSHEMERIHVCERTDRRSKAGSGPSSVCARMLRGAPPSGSCRTFPAMSLTPTRRTARLFLLGALYGAGIRHFDVASIPEIEDAATIPGAHLHFMHPGEVAHRHPAGVREFGVRSFALDSEDELKKIAEETGGCRDLTLWVRVAVPSRNSKIPLERKYGTTGAKAARLLVKARQARQGARHHLPRRLADVDARTRSRPRWPRSAS